MADGREIPSPPKLTGDADAVDGPSRSWLRDLVISHVGTEVNAVLDLDYEVVTREPANCIRLGRVF
jgi:hypothetical protein